VNYIGSKQKLAPWIKEVVDSLYVGKLEDATFADIFAGTGQVARHFKKYVKKVITNDLESYSFVLNSHYIGNTKPLDVVDVPLTKKVGVISKQFSELGDMKRKYFTQNNAQLIDGVRFSIEKLLTTNKISKEQYYWLMASLIEAADSVANTASIYGAYLKEYKKTALKPLNFKLIPYDITNQENEIYQMDANELVKKISGDILYLDPPYNARQYGANYHVLNKIIENKDFKSDKVTGLTEYNKSDYCKKDKVFETFEQLIRDAKFKYIFISYNNEGLIAEKEFEDMLKKYGKYSLYKKEYKRFKADAKRPNQAPTTFEHLHVLTKDNI
jgi:adenine-specific DNA-methyltransferase